MFPAEIYEMILLRINNCQTLLNFALTNKLMYNLYLHQKQNIINKFLVTVTKRNNTGEWEYCLLNNLKHGPEIGYHWNNSFWYQINWEFGRQISANNSLVYQRKYNYNIESFEVNWGINRYQDGVKHGIQEKYYYESIDKFTSKIKRVTNYYQGLKDIFSVSWYYSGRLEYYCSYRLGEKSGTENYYYDNNQLASSTSWRNNQKDGLAKRYHRDGRLLSISLWRNDKPDGYQINIQDKNNIIFSQTS